MKHVKCLHIVYMLFTWLLAATAFGALTITPGPPPTLHWIACGDDGMAGTSSVYDIRYSLEPITEDNWVVAGNLHGEPIPRVAGTVEHYAIEGLEPGTRYYFAIKAADEVPNWTLLSNVVSYTTPSDCDTPLKYDVNCSGQEDISDLVYMIDYMFTGGPR